MEWIIALVAVAGVVAFGLKRRNKKARAGGGSLSKGSDTQLK